MRFPVQKVPTGEQVDGVVVEESTALETACAACVGRRAIWTESLLAPAISCSVPVERAVCADVHVAVVH